MQHIRFLDVLDDLSKSSVMKFYYKLVLQLSVATNVLTKNDSVTTYIRDDLN